MYDTHYTVHGRRLNLMTAALKDFLELMVS